MHIKKINGSSSELSIQEFTAMNRGRQIRFLWQKGTFLLVRMHKEYRINLYISPNFYCEVWYKFGKNTIYKITSFTNTDKLLPYYGSINVDEIIRNDALQRRKKIS